MVAAIEETLTTSPSPEAASSGRQRPDRGERPAPVDPEHLVDELVGQPVQVAVGDRPGHAGRVDQDVGAAEALADGLGQPVEAGAVGHRCREGADGRCRAATAATASALAAVAVVADDDRGPGRGEQAGAGGADAARAAADHGDLAGEWNGWT